MLGETLKSLGYESGLYPSGDYVAVKVPVFSFEKLQDVDTMLGPEMKSTGECLGIGRTFEDALLKGLIAAGYDLKKEGGVLISVRDSDKQEILLEHASPELMERLKEMVKEDGRAVWLEDGHPRNSLESVFLKSLLEWKEKHPNPEP